MSKQASLRTKYRTEGQALYNAISRCHNRNDKGFGRYGARGIFVDEDLRSDRGLEILLATIGPRPSSKHSLDRIDNDGHYTCGTVDGLACNLRWASPRQQLLNRRPYAQRCIDLGWGLGKTSYENGKHGVGGRTSPLIPYRGELRPLADVCGELGFKTPTIADRLRKGMSPEEALTKPLCRLGETHEKPDWDLRHYEIFVLKLRLDQAIAQLEQATAHLGGRRNDIPD